VLYSAEGARFHAGTSTSLSIEMTDYLVESAVVLEGRAQFVILEINKTRVGILNIYAPNDTGHRARFCNNLAEFPFQEACWMATGDFNMTELSSDKSHDFNARYMGRREESAWARFTLRLGIQDVFHSEEYRKIGNKMHTWRRECSVPTWSRLDRFYIDSNLRLRGGRYGIWQTLQHISDYAPIFLQIQFSKHKWAKQPFFNKCLINDNDAQIEFQRAWEDAMNSSGDFKKGTRIATSLE
jgi:hypothetical protein